MSRRLSRFRPPHPPLVMSRPLERGRELLRTANDTATETLHPLIVVCRGLRRLAAAGRQRWSATPRERRGPVVALGAVGALAVALVPYGPLAAVALLTAAAAWAGRDSATRETGPSEAERARLHAVYEALVPYFSVPDDPDPLYVHGGAPEAAFVAHAFDPAGRPERLELRYPPYYPDGEAASRERIEQVLRAKCGRGREYLFGWDEEANVLEMTVLPALPADIGAQPFVTSPGETVLGFTDHSSGVRRTLPVYGGEDGTEPRDEPPVVWRTGPRSTAPHLIALGRPGSGTTTLLRSVALQALRDGDVLVVDGGGTGEYAFLNGRPGVLSVECGLTGALAALEWAAHETERRLIAAQEAQGLGQPVPEDVRRPLWILLDRPAVLTQLAASEERHDPQDLLRVPLRHGRAAQVTVVVADQFETAESLSEAVRTLTPARVVLGAYSSEQVRAVLGAPPNTTPTPDFPPGRGYARLGPGPVHRLQVPATPDPADEEAPAFRREAVLALLPEPAPAASADR